MAELLIGLLLLAIGAVVNWWARQLVWIMIYPPPAEKQIFDVLPYALIIVGAVLIIDSARRFSRKAEWYSNLDQLAQREFSRDRPLNQHAKWRGLEGHTLAIRANEVSTSRPAREKSPSTPNRASDILF